MLKQIQASKLKLLKVDECKKMTRSETMARVKSRNTGPEMTVRRALFADGLRYKVNSAKLPGTPDIVLTSRRTAVFIHGCFWHQHPGCKRASFPLTNVAYWTRKFNRNLQRDAEVKAALIAENWHLVVLWECEIKNVEKLRNIVEEIKQLPVK